MHKLLPWMCVRPCCFFILSSAPTRFVRPCRLAHTITTPALPCSMYQLLPLDVCEALLALLAAVVQISRGKRLSQNAVRHIGHILHAHPCWPMSI